MRWQQRVRMGFIERRLGLVGYVSRKDLMDAFDISRAVASQDFTDYQRNVPYSMAYDASRKTYVKGSQFRMPYLRWFETWLEHVFYRDDRNEH